MKDLHDFVEAIVSLSLRFFRYVGLIIIDHFLKAQVGFGNVHLELDRHM
jgi:hypothetical protein